MKKWSKKLYFSKLILTKIILKKLGKSLKKQKEKKLQTTKSSKKDPSGKEKHH